MVRLGLLLLAVAVTCCVSPARYPEPRCVSECGVNLHIGSEDCASFKDIEAPALEVLSRNTGWQAGELCEALNGYAVGVRPTGDRGSWFSKAHGQNILGETDCQLKFISVGDDKWHKNAYIHEIAHVYECSKGWWADSVDHKDWDKMGVYAAIDEFRR